MASALIPCEKCGTPRMTRVTKGVPRSRICLRCYRQGARRILTSRGYVHIRLSKDDFFYPMCHNKLDDCQWGVIYEHRLVMAKHLGRCLTKEEVVHHKNGVKSDNRLENLELLPNSIYHVSDSLLRKEVIGLRKKVAELESLLADFRKS